MNILMVYFCGRSFQILEEGQTAIRNDKGKLITKLVEQKQGLIIFKKQAQNWRILKNY